MTAIAGSTPGIAALSPSGDASSPDAHLDDSTRDAFCEALAALDHAESAGEPMALCQALAQVGRCYRGIDAYGPAESYLLRGLKLALSLDAADASVDLLCELAEVSACMAQELDVQDGRAAHAARDRARDHGFEATRLVRHSADPQWEVTVLLRISEVLDSLGDRDDAIALQCRALGLISGQGERPTLPSAPTSRAPGVLM